MFLAIAVGLVVAADKSKQYYVCNCMDDCKCSTVAKEPGKCACGKELTGMHLLGVDKGKAIMCRCGVQCASGARKIRTSAAAASRSR